MRAAAVLALSAILPIAAACGGGDSPATTPAPSTISASPVARHTPFPSTPPVPHRGLAHELGRDDCPADWRAWVSEPTGFSICYPPSWEERSPLGPWDEATAITLPQAGLSAAAAVFVVYLDETTGHTWSECDEPDSVTLLGHPATLCVWGNDVMPPGLDYEHLIVEAYGYYVPYGYRKLAVSVTLYGQLKPDAGPECFFTPPAGFRGGAFVPPESCMNRTYDPDVKATAFDIFETLRGP